MRINHLHLSSFRNYDQLTLDVGPRLNIFVGDNAQGKTNLLEAIQILASTHSFRSARDADIIQLCQNGQVSEMTRFEKVAVISAEVEREDAGTVLMEVRISSLGKKNLQVNGARRSRLSDYLGHLTAVCFNSFDLDIIAGEPQDRRRFLNLEISQLNPIYNHYLLRYRRALEQRNRLLHDMAEYGSGDNGLDAWTDQIVEYGAHLFERRDLFVKEISPLAQTIHSELTNGEEKLDIRYLCSALQNGTAQPTDRPEMDWGQAFRSDLERVASDELRRGMTLSGPQRDDLSILINGSEARVFASQGQQRTAALSLKMAEFEVAMGRLGENPVLLLDDVLSDLDPQRQRILLEKTNGFGQTFLSTTTIKGFPETLLEQSNIYEVKGGAVTQNAK